MNFRLCCSGSDLPPLGLPPSFAAMLSATLWLLEGGLDVEETVFP